MAPADFSNLALAGVLQQDEDSKLYPAACYSPKLSPAEINYDVHDKEFLAVAETFHNMRVWILGSSHPVFVCCAHENLEYFITSCTLNRWQANFRLDRIPGKRTLLTFQGDHSHFRDRFFVLKCPFAQLLVGHPRCKHTLKPLIETEALL